MIDAVKIQIPFQNAAELLHVYSNPVFENKQEKYLSKTGEPYLTASLRNQNIIFYPLQEYATSTNSLIKFHFYKNASQNIVPEYYCNLTYSGLCSIADYYSAVFNVSCNEMKILSMEYSLTVSTPEPSMNYIKGFQNFRHKDFYYLPPPRNCAFPMEKYCPFTHYTIKGYDYGAKNGFKQNFLRWEIPFRKMQKVCKITGRKKTTLDDLKDEYFLNAVHNFSMKTFRNTIKTPIIDYSALKPRQREFLFAGINPEYWKKEKGINLNTAKKKRTDFLKLYKEATGNGNEPYHDLERKLKEKFDYLLSN